MKIMNSLKKSMVFILLLLGVILSSAHNLKAQDYDQPTSETTKPNEINFFSQGMVYDKEGNVFISDTLRHYVRRIDAKTGTVTNVAGRGEKGFDGDGRTALTSLLSYPAGLAFDEEGNLFIADTGNNRIRRVDSKTNIMTTIAGTGEIGFGGDNSLAVDAKLDFPTKLAFDQNGNLFVVDTLNNRVRKINPYGIITTVAGNGNILFIRSNVPATSASISPYDIAIDAHNNLFIADSSNYRIWLVDSETQIITTVVANGRDFLGEEPLVDDITLPTSISSVTIDSDGNLSLSDAFNNHTRKVNLTKGFITYIKSDKFFLSNPFVEGNFSHQESLPQESLSLSDLPNLSQSKDLESKRAELKDMVRIAKAISLSSLTPTIDPIGNKVLFAGSSLNVNVSASDFVDSNNHLNLSLSYAPNYVSLTDNGNGTGLITIKPGFEVAETSPVVVRATNSKGLSVELSFNVTVFASLTIFNARFSKASFTIKGTGFGTAGAQVIVNSKDITSLLSSQTNTNLLLQGNKKELNIKKGSNSVVVLARGMNSNVFVFNFFVDSLDSQ